MENKRSSFFRAQNSKRLLIAFLSLVTLSIAVLGGVFMFSGDGLDEGDVGASNTRPLDDNLFTSIATSSFNTFGITESGELWYWGRLNGGVRELEPVRVGARSDWLMVSAGGMFVLAITQDGELWGWGANNLGQLGDGTLAARESFSRIGNRRDWKYISAAHSAAAGITRSGELWIWGGTYVSSETFQTVVNRIPVQVGYRTDWIQVVVRNHNSLAAHGGTLGLTSSGHVWHILINQFPMNIIVNSITNRSDWRYLSNSSELGSHWLLITQSNELYSFGDNQVGQLGLGVVGGPIRNEPVRVGVRSDWLMAAVAGGGNNGRSWAITISGELWVWGQQGVLSSGLHGPTPNRFGNQENWIYVTGANHGMVLRSDNSLWGWGRKSTMGNEVESLGDINLTPGSSEKILIHPTVEPIHKVDLLFENAYASDGQSDMTHQTNGPLPSAVQTPTRAGWTFSGYYFNHTSTFQTYGTRAFDGSGNRVFNTNIPFEYTGPIRFIARWTPIDFQITLNSNGLILSTDGTWVTSTGGATPPAGGLGGFPFVGGHHIHTNNTQLPASVNIPTRHGYRLLGLYWTDPNGQTYARLFDELGHRTQGTPWYIASNIVAQTLTARWERNTTFVTFTLRPGENWLEDDYAELRGVVREVIYGNAVADVPPAPYLENYRFLFWAVYGSTSEFDLSTPIAEAVTLLPVWERYVFTVTFNPGLGNMSATNVDVTLGNGIPLPTPNSPPIVPSGQWVFLGWSNTPIENMGVGTVADVNFFPGTTMPNIREHRELWAVWQWLVGSHMVILNNMDGNPPTFHERAHGDFFELENPPRPSWVPEEYVFLGWATSEYQALRGGLAQRAFFPTENIMYLDRTWTLFAIWGTPYPYWEIEPEAGRPGTIIP